jgi:hypothetical protein
MALSTALFVFGATQHVGLEIGRFSEPVIVPAAIVALAAGRGPRTVSNDNLHRAMLTLIGLSFVVLFMARAFPGFGKK